MQPENYWLSVFSGYTWEKFLENGGKVIGFRKVRWATVKKLKKGDFVVCYLAGISRLVGILKVISDPYLDDSPIWNIDFFPSRVKVEPVLTLEPEYGVPITNLKNELSIFINQPNETSWTGYVSMSPLLWKETDGKTAFQALMNAKENPNPLPFDPKKIKSRPWS